MEKNMSMSKFKMTWVILNDSICNIYTKDHLSHRKTGGWQHIAGQEDWTCSEQYHKTKQGVKETHYNHLTFHFKTELAGEGDSLTFLSQIQYWSKVPLQYLRTQFTAKGSVCMVVILLA